MPDVETLKPNGAVMTDLAGRRKALETRFPQWEPRTLGGFLDDCAAEFGDRPVVITDDRTITYSQAALQASELADGLHALGIRPGDHVGLLMANYAEFFPLKFAIAKAGAVAVPMNYLYRQEELAYVLGQSQVSALITMTGFSGLDYLEMLDCIVPGWDSPERGQHAAAPKLRNVIQLSTDGRERDGVLTVAGLARRGLENSGASSGISVNPNAAADIMYTSGSTGSPKGVLLTHDAELRTAYAAALTRAFEDGRRILFSLPCYHMFGYDEGILASMMVGGASIMLTKFTAEGYLSGIARHRATDILCVPTMTVALLEFPGRKDYDLSSLKAILSGSAPAPIWLWEQVATELGVTEIVTGYGMTETGGPMTLTFPEDRLELTATTVGRPQQAGVAGLADRGGDITRYAAVDPFTGEVLPDGETGELVSWGPTNMLGYWDKPEETAKALRGGGVYSGDLGRVRPDGYIEVTGRTKEMYKSGGELVMPKEIEELLSAHPQISQVYAVGVPDDRWGEIGCVCVVRAPGATITEEEVLGLCKEKLARFKVPKMVWFLDQEELPLTPTGKVQKFRLVQQATKRMGQKA